MQPKKGLVLWLILVITGVFSQQVTLAYELGVVYQEKQIRQGKTQGKIPGTKVVENSLNNDSNYRFSNNKRERSKINSRGEVAGKVKLRKPPISSSNRLRIEKLRDPLELTLLE